MTYDGDGHRIRLVETTAGGTPIVTTDFSYEGDRVVREVSTSSAGPIVTRSFTTDEAGAIIKVTIVTTGGGSTADDGTYLVTYNGHGDAIGLAEITGTGELDPAARITYSTWGTPDVDPVGSFGDLKFRYLYVGRFDVQWDDFASAGLLYMHARHYHPEFGRFLQPDPSAAETNLYAYAENSPITKADPTGRFWFAVILVGLRVTVWVAPRVFAAARALKGVGSLAKQVAIRVAPKKWLTSQGYTWRPHHITHHGVPLWKTALTLARGTRFRYWHDKQCKIGVWDPILGVFVAISDGKFIFTSFQPSKGYEYVRGLKKLACPSLGD